MAIAFNCPHCGLPYRLKDELAGKKATCKNPDCRQLITIPAPQVTVPPTASDPPAKPANGTAPKPAARKDQTPAPKPPPPKPEDLEAAALQALADAPKEEQPAEAPIPVVCAFCDHKWTEPREKAGKNVLCPNPECRQRNKVPVPKDEKPKNWRDADTGPSLRKELFEKPTDVVTSGDSKYAGADALKQAGALDHELEPVPLKRRLVFALLILTPIVGLGYGVYWYWNHRTTSKQDQLVETAFKEFDPAGLAPAEAHLYSAMLHTAAGQYELTETEEPAKGLKKALDHFTKARDELRQAGQKDDPKKGPSAARYAVGGELALAQLGLGGDDDAVKEGARYRWVPQAPTGRQLRVNEKSTDVHTELQRTLQVVAPADYDLRVALARRLTRDLVKRKQVDVAADLPVMLFAAPEQAEAKAVVALEVYRADKAHPFPRQAADDLKAALAKGPDPKGVFPASAVVLWKTVGTEKAPTLGDGKLPSPTTNVPDSTRAIAVGLALLDGKADEAADAARRPGSLKSQLQAAVLVAEWSPDPGAAVDVALAQIARATAGKKTLDPAAAPPTLLLRLSQLSAAGGKAEQAKQLADAITDDGLKAWAKADAARLAAAAGTRLDEGAVEAPDDPAKLRAGHGWGRFWVARHNTRISQDRTKEEKAIAGWPKGTIHPLGLAGVALGLREK